MKNKNFIIIALMIICINSVTSCKKKESPTPAPTYTIGQSYGGGIVFYIDGTGQHGLIAAPNDQSTASQWTSDSTLISGCSSTSLGSGQANTNAIIAACTTAGIAAQLCNDLVIGNYSDWFLPSKDELNLLQQQKYKVSGFDNTNFNLSFWSSSEINKGNAWAQYFYDGIQSAKGKITTNYVHVRAIRAF